MKEPHVEAWPDWAALIADAATRGPASAVTLVRTELVESAVEVVFDGANWRPGRFGVRIHLPREIGDDRWQEMAFPKTASEWAWIAAIVEILEPYEAMSDSDIAAPDVHGIRWLVPV